MSSFNIISESDKSTVVTEYTPEKRTRTAYQSEAELEKDFIKLLASQGYEYVNIKNETKLLENLRCQIEKLNDFRFTDNEWNKFYSSVIANRVETIDEKTKKIQQNHVHTLTLDNGKDKNIKLIDKNDIHKNHLQVLNQYKEDGGTYKSRYDVTILVNGLPLVHIELKARGVKIREAFNQIARYQRDSFWAGSGIFDYVQIFVISNGTDTKYYSNTTRDQHIKNNINGAKGVKAKTSHSFEFTSNWADGNNKNILDIVDFTKTFFAKHAILNILIKYCVFTSEHKLLVMRPYQIFATERILGRIKSSAYNKTTGTLEAGGYIWHTTGSGKTLTSFKTAQLATELDYIDKVLFVVDRKDLDYQTMKEYDRFEKGAADSNTSTKILKRQLENADSKIIITTIQKLDRFINTNKDHAIYAKHLVIIFDECHRSQFGDMRTNITKTFKKYHMFGFTGTPIFAINSSASSKNPTLATTEQAFGAKLHTYTIVNAINDKNVLPFKLDYLTIMKMSGNTEDTNIVHINKESDLLNPERIRLITSYILENFDQQTYRNQHQSNYEQKIVTNINEVAGSKYNKVKAITESKNLNGFNSIFAVASTKMAKAYYNEFKKQTEESGRKLNFATIFTYNPNEEQPDGNLPDEDLDTTKMDKPSRDFLEDAIKDYNDMFKVNYDTSSDSFSNYYKDVSWRMKNRELDMLIVVNMFLTGFDATTLNTLWVDKNLKQHGLIQSFSRTNRILNDVKQFGNIICFRNLEQATEEALSLFGDKDAKGIILLRPYEDYMNGYDEDDDDEGKHISGYSELVEQLKSYPIGEEIIGEKENRDYIELMGTLLKVRNILQTFDQFKDVISEADFQDYKSMYIDKYQEYCNKSDATPKYSYEGLVFEIELIKQVEVTIDYILQLVEQYKESNCQDKIVLTNIWRTIDSNIDLRSKKPLVEQFIENQKSGITWNDFSNKSKNAELDMIIKDEHLNADKTKTLINNAFSDGYIKTMGTDLDQILPPISRFGDTSRTEIKEKLIIKLQKFFEKYS